MSRSTKTARSRSSARTGSGRTPQPAPAAPPATPPRAPSPLLRELVGIALLLLAVFVGLFRARPNIEPGDQAPVVALAQLMETLPEHRERRDWEHTLRLHLYKIYYLPSHSFTTIRFHQV